MDGLGSAIVRSRRLSKGAWRPASKHCSPTPMSRKDSVTLLAAVGLGVVGQGRLLEEMPLTWTSMDVAADGHVADPLTESTKYTYAGKLIVRAVQVFVASLTFTVNRSRFCRGRSTLSQYTAEPGSMTSSCAVRALEALMLFVTF